LKPLPPGKWFSFQAAADDSRNKRITQTPCFQGVFHCRKIENQESNDQGEGDSTPESTLPTSTLLPAFNLNLLYRLKNAGYTDTLIRV
jgi:hypothetical protein